MASQRNPLRRMLVAIAVPLVLPGCISAGPAPERPLGVQLYTVRADMERSQIATLRQIAALGYDEVEYAGTFGMPPAGLCRETRALGLGVAAAHADWKRLRDDPVAAIAEAQALCADTLMLAWLPEEERRTAGQWRWWVAHLNEVAELAEAQGLRLAYHAHDFEFAEVDGVRPIDLLMEGLDPAIGFELDTYWVAKAGVDPLAFLKSHADRVTHVHLKDMAANGSMADVGAGTLDIAAIVAQAEQQGVRHFLVERDDAPDPWASLATSLDSLRAMPLQRGTTSTASGSANP